MERIFEPDARIAFATRTAAVFIVSGGDLRRRDLVATIAGLFLLGDSTYAMHDKLYGRRQGAPPIESRLSYLMGRST